jgi:hypothetical protein
MASEETIKEELEKIHQIHLHIKDIMNFVLVYLGEKPAYSTTLYYSEKMIGLTLKNFMLSEERLEKELSLTSLNFKIIENKQLDEDGFLEVYHYVFVSKDKKNIEDIERAIRNEDIIPLSKLIGYYKAINIINALSKSKSNKDFQNIDSLFILKPKDLKEWWESLDKKERDELKNEKVLNFLTLPLSKKDWRKELEMARKYQKIIKEKFPELYQEIIEKRQAEEYLWPIQSEEERSVYFKKIIEYNFDLEEELKVIKDFAIILTLFDFIVHLYDPGNIKKTPFWGPFVEITIKNELEYYEDFQKLDWEEKEEIEEKRNNFYKKKLFSLLSDFYKNRNVDWDVGLHVESGKIGRDTFILSNIGASFLGIFSEEERQIKYRKYNEEIKEFTESLKQRYIDNLRKRIFFE